MKYLYYGLIISFLLPQLAVAASNTVILSIGSNESISKSLKPLKYAESDALRFSKAMKSVGAVGEGRSIAKTGISIAEFRKTMLDLRSNFSETFEQKDSKVIFYFSGHANDLGFHFRDGILPKFEFHSLFNLIPAKTRVAILDTCFSGALSSKGVKPAPSFELPKVELDSPTGNVFLSASSGKQFAYESESLKSGVFTHFLLKGLSGNADGNTDGLVTIDELYQFVYKSTKWQSMNQTMTSQDPGYSANLKGHGAIIMSFPAQKKSSILLSKKLAGEFVFASVGGMQMFQYTKYPGQTNVVDLPVGYYDVSLVDGSRLGNATIEVVKEKSTLLTIENFEWEASIDNFEDISKGEIQFPGLGKSETYRLTTGDPGWWEPRLEDFQSIN